MRPDRRLRKRSKTPVGRARKTPAPSPNKTIDGDLNFGEMNHLLIRLLLAVSILAGAFPAPQTASAQQLEREVGSTKYLRNSVSLIMMDDYSVPQKHILRHAFLNARWNNKYNNHNLKDEERVIDPSRLAFSQKDLRDFDRACLSTPDYLYVKHLGIDPPRQKMYDENSPAAMRRLMSELNRTVDTVSPLTTARRANKYLIEQKIARRCLDRWFFDSEGNYTDSILVERGLMNATAEEQELAAASLAARQKLLREKIDFDELIGNTFVVVTRFNYKDKEALVRDRMMPFYLAASLDDSGYATLGLQLTEMGIRASIGAGYYVVVDSYLFRLRWNEEIEDGFNKLWDAEGSLDMEHYLDSDFASLQFLGNERAWAKTHAGIFSGKSEDELIYLAAIDAVDKVLAKFERKYDQFKTKTPLHIVSTHDKRGREKETYAVKLGTRDGLEGGEIFEVLEVEKVAGEDGKMKIRYHKKGELAVDRNAVWDNASDSPTERPYTLLKGKRRDKFYQGMLLRLKTTKK